MTIKTFKDYEEAAAVTAVWGEDQHPILYCIIGLIGEAGELANKIKKSDLPGMRGDVPFADIVESLIDENSDVLWYVAMLAKELDVSLEDVANRNIEKLRSRQERGVIKGNGDER